MAVCEESLEWSPSVSTAIALCSIQLHTFLSFSVGQEVKSFWHWLWGCTHLGGRGQLKTAQVVFFLLLSENKMAAAPSASISSLWNALLSKELGKDSLTAGVCITYRFISQNWESLLYVLQVNFLLRSPSIQAWQDQYSLSLWLVQIWSLSWLWSKCWQLRRCHQRLTGVSDHGQGRLSASVKLNACKPRLSTEWWNCPTATPCIILLDLFLKVATTVSWNLRLIL